MSASTIEVKSSTPSHQLNSDEIISISSLTTHHVVTRIVDENEYASLKQLYKSEYEQISASELYTEKSLYKKLLETWTYHHYLLWRNYFNFRNGSTNDIDRNQIRELRQLICQQTKRIQHLGYYYVYDDGDVDSKPSEILKIIFNIKQLDYSKNNSKIIDKPFKLWKQIKLKNDSTNNKNCIYNVVEGDCLEVALSLLQSDFNPVVLNMASSTNNGGGWESGAGAQEENLFRRSTYENASAIVKYDYPIPEFGGVYSPAVTVFRSSEITGYKLLKQPYLMSFIAVAAYVHPKLVKVYTDNADYNESNYHLELDAIMTEKTKEKIRTILSLALLHNHDSIVLSAFGCGAFKNPPGHIAQLFKDVLLEFEFENQFKQVCFAILNDHNVGKMHNPDGNFIPFQQAFQQLNTNIGANSANLNTCIAPEELEVHSSIL
ncbi:unnamed protein product [Didymodactylos carnosus]|uniref:Microbial-type PARG catalytic domain-containing protein n=1 Tax=Didymodactylos carnosus TaxID=1234261 RepID=A0A815RL97_9BILA|nr:unnamed protein product [Didymodactylos carnosus]CAF1476585.1 unnamed protein product [Didymodactylos carnosus]CAF4140487.1 unnamed protein product [Didymodactylos carnosus]CAF4342602.1 unnamed protein product [Didymodactylos carnosus]